MSDDFEHFEDMEESELWEQTTHGLTETRIHALMTLAHRATDGNAHAQAASIQERIADLYLESKKTDDALVAFARAISAWQEVEEWENIEILRVKAEALSDSLFEAGAWREFYAAYGWAAYQRRAYVVALEYVEKAIACTEESGSTHYRALHLWQKGVLTAALGRSAEGIVFLQEGLSLAREESNLFMVADILADLSIIQSRTLDRKAALAPAEEAAALLAEVPPFVPLNFRVKFALGNAYLCTGATYLAFVTFESIHADLPNYLKAKALIRMSECGYDDEMWESRAYTVAKNSNAFDLVDHIEVTRAMRADPHTAIAVLTSVIERTIERDDDMTRDEARLVLARKLCDAGRHAEAVEQLTILSVANFGDDAYKILTYLILRADALIAVGELVEARSIALSLSRLDRRWEVIDAIAEGHWQLATIELAANGPTIEWERLANQCISLLALDGDFALLQERAEILSGAVVLDNQPYRGSLDTIDALIADIANEAGSPDWTATT